MECHQGVKSIGQRKEWVYAPMFLLQADDRLEF